MMEYTAIELQAIKAVMKKFDELVQISENVLCRDGPEQREWIENSQLAQTLHISLKTLQNYRERGLIGFTLLGRKVYYKRHEIHKFLESHYIEKKDGTNY